jgi:hypothetical protein
MTNPKNETAPDRMARSSGPSETLESPGDRGISRRVVLAAGLAAGPMIVPRFVLGGPGYQAPSDTLRIAAVGVGGMGSAYLKGCSHERVVALCDLDHNRSAKVFAAYPTATRYHDFRQMLDKEEKNFDALIVATPDHTHAIILMAAIRLGKHIYCAKPITHTIGEARKVTAALRKNPRLVTKASVQSSGTEGARSSTELLTSGVLGPIREVHVWSDHPAYPCSLLRPTETQTPPAGMDWDLWLGPAPFRPYHSTYHPLRWRPWWDFGSSAVGDVGCHTFHFYFKELRLEAPTLIHGSSSTRQEGWFKQTSTPECASAASLVTWDYPERGGLPPLRVHWYDGGLKPQRPAELDHRLGLPASGVLFVGEQGKLITDYAGGYPFGPLGRKRSGGLLLPEEKFKDFDQPAPTLPRVADHYKEWTQSCKTGATTACPVEFGAAMTETALLGALALRTGRILEWDSPAMKVGNSEVADGLVDPPYRAGWSL